MSDNRRRFIAIYQAIKKLYPTEPSGNLVRHLKTLSMLISGIVASKHTHLPAIASKVPSLAKVESRIKRFCRWIDNERIDFEGYYLPYAQQLLTNLANQTVVLIMDGSPVGRGCRTLMCGRTTRCCHRVSVVYKNRALPLTWLVAEGNRGHFSEESQISLMRKVSQAITPRQQVKEITPKGADVMFLGDGEFDGIKLQAKIEGYGWKYVCRTAKDTIITQDDEVLTFEKLQVCSLRSVVYIRP